MPKPAEENYQAWFTKAEEDEFAGNLILGEKRLPAPACFHFQQMAEKLLKTLLVFHGKAFPKIHDLVALAGLVKSLASNIETLREDIEFLSRYYVATRYPGDYPEFTVAECKQAQEAALRIKQFVIQEIDKAKKNNRNKDRQS